LTAAANAAAASSSGTPAPAAITAMVLVVPFQLILYSSIKKQLL
jgi:hypothetical protein